MSLRSALEAVQKRQKEEQQIIDSLKATWDSYLHYLSRVPQSHQVERKKAIAENMVNTLSQNYLPKERLAAFRTAFDANQQDVARSRHTNRLAVALGVSFVCGIVPGMILAGVLAIRSRLSSKRAWNFFSSHGHGTCKKTQAELEKLSSPITVL